MYYPLSWIWPIRSVIFLAFFLLYQLPLDLRAQASPKVPTNLKMMGMKLRIDNRAKAQIQTFVDQYTSGKKGFDDVVKLTDKYFPIIEQHLADAGVPDEIKMVALKESMLVSDVKSKYGTVGFWQFKEETAKEHGLRVDGLVDERINLSASTLAAAELIKKNNEFFNNWIYAIQAFNQGLGGAKKSTNPQWYGKNKMDITADTHPYILRFLAFQVAYQGAIGQNPNPDVNLIERKVSGASIASLASQYGVSVSDLKAENKWLLRGDDVPSDKSYTMLIPIQQGSNISTDEASMQPDPVANDGVDLDAPDQDLIPTDGSHVLVDMQEGRVLIRNGTEQIASLKIKDSEKERAAFLQMQKLEFKLIDGNLAVKARKGDTLDELGMITDIDRSRFARLNMIPVFMILQEHEYYLLE